MVTRSPEKELGYLILTQSEPVPDSLVERIRSDIVYSHTGKPWAEWYAILDNVNVPHLGHEASALYLAELHGIGDWWADTIVTRYEVVLGLR